MLKSKPHQKLEKPHQANPILQAQLEHLETITDADIDLSDMSETVDWSKAVRGKYYRPL